MVANRSSSWLRWHGGLSALLVDSSMRRYSNHCMDQSAASADTQKAKLLKKSINKLGFGGKKLRKYIHDTHRITSLRRSG